MNEFSVAKFIFEFSLYHQGILIKRVDNGNLIPKMSSLIHTIRSMHQRTNKRDSINTTFARDGLIGLSNKNREVVTIA